MGLAIFFAIALVSAFLWHYFLPRNLPATFGATATTVLAFQIVDYVHLGYLEPFFLIAAATSSVVALLVSALVGLPFQARRKQQRPEIHGL